MILKNRMLSTERLLSRNMEYLEEKKINFSKFRFGNRMNLKM